MITIYQINMTSIIYIIFTEINDMDIGKNKNIIIL